jgi:hypothetical protein
MRAVAQESRVLYNLQQKSLTSRATSVILLQQMSHITATNVSYYCNKCLILLQQMSNITATKVADYLQLPRAAGYITGDTLQITLLLACYMRAVAHERGVFDRLRIVCHTSASVSIRQHTSAYVSIRQHTS